MHYFKPPPLVVVIDFPSLGHAWKIDVDIPGFRNVIKNPWNKFYWQQILQIGHYEELLGSIRVGEGDNHITWAAYWELMIALRMLATVTRIRMRKQISSFDAESALKKVLFVEANSLADFLSKTTDIDTRICIRFLDLMVFNPTLRHLEIWDTPLIKSSENMFLFSPAIIEPGSPLRTVENFIAQWNEALFEKRGEILEKELFNSLNALSEVRIQQNVKFKDNKQREIECDLVIWWENTLLVVEAKCRKSIFDSFDAFQAKKQIEKAMDQLNFRKEVIVNNWSDFRSVAKELELPEKEAENIRLIAVTNNPHFTGWQKGDVIVTDEFCIRRFFDKAEVEAFSGDKVIATVGRIRESEDPTIIEFLRYLTNPPQVKIVRDGLKVDPIFLPLVKETDPKIAVFHTSYTPKEYNFTFKPQKKIGRNMPCPCGSGFKYKKCCGSKRS